jgi:hypothetical protein
LGKKRGCVEGGPGEPWGRPNEQCTMPIDRQVGWVFEEALWTGQRCSPDGDVDGSMQHFYRMSKISRVAGGHVTRASLGRVWRTGQSAGGTPLSLALVNSTRTTHLSPFTTHHSTPLPSLPLRNNTSSLVLCRLQPAAPYPHLLWGFCSVCLRCVGQLFRSAGLLSCNSLSPLLPLLLHPTRLALTLSFLVRRLRANHPTRNKSPRADHPQSRLSI